MKKPIIILLVIMLFLIPSAAFAESKNTMSNEIDLYEYPVTTDMGEWKLLDNHIDMIEVCTIPEELVKLMSTEELILNTLNYPLIGDMFAWNSDKEGYYAVREYCVTLRELEDREDIESAINYVEDSLTEYFERESLRYDVARVVLNIIETELGLIESNPDYVLLDNRAVVYRTEVTNNNVKTPNGTKIKHYEDLTYNCKDGDTGETLVPTQATVQTKQSQLVSQYPLATVERGICPTYNCHSYAWHSTSSTNPYWINNPKKYWTDGSYVVVNSAASGRRLVYFNGSTVLHSAKYTSSGSNVRSKWGYCGLFTHAISYCPYYSASTVRKIYKRAS